MDNINNKNSYRSDDPKPFQRANNENYLSLFPNADAQQLTEANFSDRFLEKYSPCLPLRTIMVLNIW